MSTSPKYLRYVVKIKHFILL